MRLVRSIRGSAVVLALAVACGDEPAGPPEPATVALTLEDADGNPSSAADLVAYQDGDGPWQVLAGDAPFAVTILTGRYGFLVGCTSPRTFDHGTRLTFATTAETTAVSLRSCDPSTWPLLISGRLAGLAGEDLVLTTGLHGYGRTAGGTEYSLPTRPGPNELLMSEIVGGQNDGPHSPGRMVRRDLGVLTGDRVEDIDLATGELPTVTPMTITGLDAGDERPYTRTTIAVGDSFLWTPEHATDPPSYLGPPASVLHPGERISVQIYADQWTDEQNGSITRILSQSDVTPTSTFALPAIRRFAKPTVTDGTATAWSLPAQSLTTDDRLLLQARGFLTDGNMSAEISAGWAREPLEVRFDAASDLPAWDPTWSLGADDIIWTAAVLHVEPDHLSRSGLWGVLALTPTPRQLAAPTRADVRAALHALIDVDARR